MAEGRGKKKAKKARWQLVLGLKQVLCGALGLTWMMMIIFILGVLAGRGDIYRWLSSWGLITPGPSSIALWSPPPEPQPAAAPAKSSPPGAVAKPAAPVPPTTAAAPPPVKGHIAATPSRAATPRVKKTRKEFSHRDYKAQKAELRKLRREISKKLVFQNTLDRSTPKSVHKPQKKKGKTTTVQKGHTRQVRVAQFRSLKAAQARMADLRKKGEKVSLKKGKDKKGAFYEVYREAPDKQTRPAVGLAQKTKKETGKKSKPRAKARN